jgi:hypothetical protein
MLQYEELLHNMYTREKITWCITERLNFLESIFREAIDNREITDKFTPEELANNVTGIVMSHILSRRITYHKRTFRQEFMDNIGKWIDLIKIS